MRTCRACRHVEESRECAHSVCMPTLLTALAIICYVHASNLSLGLGWHFLQMAGDTSNNNQQARAADQASQLEHNSASSRLGQLQPCAPQHPRGRGINKQLRATAHSTVSSVSLAAPGPTPGTASMIPYQVDGPSTYF
jgi:hypothetical protein